MERKYSKLLELARSEGWSETRLFQEILGVPGLREFLDNKGNQPVIQARNLLVQYGWSEREKNRFINPAFRGDDFYLYPWEGREGKFSHYKGSILKHSELHHQRCRWVDKPFAKLEEYLKGL